MRTTTTVIVCDICQREMKDFGGLRLQRNGVKIWAEPQRSYLVIPSSSFEKEKDVCESCFTVALVAACTDLTSEKAGEK